MAEDPNEMVTVHIEVTEVAIYATCAKMTKQRFRELDAQENGEKWSAKIMAEFIDRERDQQDWESPDVTMFEIVTEQAE